MCRQRWIGHGLIKSVVSRKRCKIGKTGMAAIQDTNFRFFVRIDIGCDGDANLA
jgi:hypothetical protein